MDFIFFSDRCFKGDSQETFNPGEDIDIYVPDRSGESDVFEGIIDNFSIFYSHEREIERVREE